MVSPGKNQKTELTTDPEAARTIMQVHNRK
jgi:hypothetical protein